MELYFSVMDTGSYNTDGLDLDDLWQESDATDAETFFEVLACKVAEFAIKQKVTFGDVVGYTFDHDGDETEITQTKNDPKWIHEVAELVAFINQNYDEAGPILARVNDLGWNYVDFESDLSTMRDEYYSEFPGDYEDFAREHMDNCGESINEELEYYFDYRAYGKSLLEDYDRCTWGNQEYLFTH